MRRIICLLLALIMVLSLVACGNSTSSEASSVVESETESKSEAQQEEESSEEETEEGGRWDYLHATDEEIELYVQMDIFTPSVNDEPTEENPRVQTAGKDLANAWLQDKTNVTFRWNYDMAVTDNLDEWRTVNLTAHTYPDIVYTWGTTGLEREMYIYLDEAMQSPNYYQEGSPVWQSMFPDYMFERSYLYVKDEDHVVAVPMTVAPGSATCFFYNKTIFEELDLEPTTDLDEFLDMCDIIKEAGYTAIRPTEWNLSYSTWNWDTQFSLAGQYGLYILENCENEDYDGSGEFDSWYDELKAVWLGKYYIQDYPGIKEFWYSMLDKFKRGYSQGFMTTDYTQAWADGNVAMWEDLVSYLPTMSSNTELDFEWGMMIPPVKNGEYTEDTPTTDGPYQPMVIVSETVMDPEYQGRNPVIADYAVDWLKYCTTDENLSILIEEQLGGSVGATKGCAVPAVLTEFFDQEFPTRDHYSAPHFPCMMDSIYTTFQAECDNYVNGLITFDEWCVIYDELMYEDINLYFEQYKDDEEELEFVYDEADWTEESHVKPASMR